MTKEEEVKEQEEYVTMSCRGGSRQGFRFRVWAVQLPELVRKHLERRWEEIFPKKPMDRLRWLFKACKAGGLGVAFGRCEV